MECKLNYGGRLHGTNSYGTKKRSVEHIVSVWRNGSSVAIRFDHIDPLDDGSISNPASLDITLPEKEALQLATAILNQFHFPELSGNVTRWVASTGLPVLSPDVWRGKVSVEYLADENCLEVRNASDLSIGRIGLTIGFIIGRKDSLATIQKSALRLAAELPPDSEQKFPFNTADLTPAIAGEYSVPHSIDINFVSGVSSASRKRKQGH